MVQVCPEEKRVSRKVAKDAKGGEREKEEETRKRWRTVKRRKSRGSDSKNSVRQESNGSQSHEFFLRFFFSCVPFFLLDSSLFLFPSLLSVTFYFIFLHLLYFASFSYMVFPPFFFLRLCERHLPPLIRACLRIVRGRYRFAGGFRPGCRKKSHRRPCRRGRTRWWC